PDDMDLGAPVDHRRATEATLPGAFRVGGIDGHETRIRHRPSVAGFIEPERERRLERQEIVEVRVHRERPRLAGRANGWLEIAVAWDDDPRHGAEPGQLSLDRVELGGPAVGGQVAGHDYDVGGTGDGRIDERAQRPTQLRRPI